jgi:phospholipid transport system substrate-binding protein
MSLKLAPLAVVALLAFPLGAAHAQGADPAAGVIDSFDASLVDAMKAGKAGTLARYTRLEPVVAKTFDIPAMTRFAVGAAWSSYTPAEQATLAKAFGRLTTANLAHNFSSYGGEQFKVGDVQTRGLDKLVRSQIIPAHGDPTDLNYRMRQSGGAWKVIDVYFGAVSQLSAQRSDFSASATPGHAGELALKINAKADDLLKR